MKAALQETPTQAAAETNDTRSGGVSRLFGLLEKLAFPAGACITIVAALRYVALSSRRLWFDEIYTHTITLLPTLGDVWRALCAGFDFQSLLFYWVTRLSWALGHSELAMRMPQIVGVLVFSWCLFFFVGRRLGYVFGLSAMILGLVNELEFFAGQARPYGMLVGACGLAMVAWQFAVESPRRRWAVPLFGASIFLIVASHAYAIAALVPFAIAELVRFVRTRRADWSLWACSLAALPPLALYWFPLHTIRIALASNTAILGTTKHVQWSAVPNFYIAFFGTRFILLFLVGILFVGLALLRKGGKAEASGMTRHEVALAAGLAISPVFSVALAMVVSKYYLPRYSIFAIGGLVVLAVLAIDRIANSRRMASMMLLVVSLVLFVLDGNYSRFSREEMRYRDAKLEIPYAAVPEGVPIVIASGLALLPADMYSTDAQLARTYYLLDHDLGAAYTGSTIFDFVPPFTTYYHFRTHLESYYRFVKEHKRFFVYGPYYYQDDWQVRKLRDDGAKLVEKGRYWGESDDNYLFEVEMP
jgi:hypothetical protein